MKHLSNSFAITLICLFSISTYSNAQNMRRYNCPQINTANDLDGILDIGIANEVQLRCPPKGAGNANESASGKQIDNYYFEKEHNIVWIKLKTKWPGYLNMKIVPDSINDDYDFLLFQSNEEDAISKIKAKKLKPIRTNIARNQKKAKGITGLSYFSKEKFIHSGPNNQFSNAPEVKAGETYYLAIDNVYDNGGGATIYFDYMQAKQIEGIVKDENSDIVGGAEVTWEDGRDGEILNQTTTDSLSGKFSMVVLYDMNPKNSYVLSTFSQKHFFSEVKYTPTEIHNCSPEPLAIVVPELAKGVRGTVSAMNFVGNKAEFLSSAYPSLKRLKKLMLRNEELSILIEGHTNGCTSGVRFSQTLSEDRSAAVKTYLMEAGVANSRMETIGYNCTKMLYPMSSSEKYQSMNRRVEIQVTNY